MLKKIFFCSSIVAHWTETQVLIVTVALPKHKLEGHQHFLIKKDKKKYKKIKIKKILFGRAHNPGHQY